MVSSSPMTYHLTSLSPSLNVSRIVLTILITSGFTCLEYTSSFEVFSDTRYGGRLLLYVHGRIFVVGF
ncbi:hypothetical protein Hanom_Chr02g00158631 [Helianthus anomalus]